MTNIFNTISIVHKLRTNINQNSKINTNLKKTKQIKLQQFLDIKLFFVSNLL